MIQNLPTLPNIWITNGGGGGGGDFHRFYRFSLYHTVFSVVKPIKVNFCILVLKLAPLALEFLSGVPG